MVIHELVAICDLQSLRELLDAELNADPKLIDQPDEKNQRPPLSCAIAAGRELAIIKLLIERYKANVNLADAQGYSPLYFALESHQTDIAIYLLNKGAKFNEREIYYLLTNRSDFTKIAQSITENDLDNYIFPWVNHVFTFQDCEYQGCPPLSLAASQDNAELVAKLIALGANSTYPNKASPKYRCLGLDSWQIAMFHRSTKALIALTKTVPFTTDLIWAEKLATIVNEKANFPNKANDYEECIHYLLLAGVDVSLVKDPYVNKNMLVKKQQDIYRNTISQILRKLEQLELETGIRLPQELFTKIVQTAIKRSNISQDNIAYSLQGNPIQKHSISNIIANTHPSNFFSKKLTILALRRFRYTMFPLFSLEVDKFKEVLPVLKKETHDALYSAILQHGVFQLLMKQPHRRKTLINQLAALLMQQYKEPHFMEYPYQLTENWAEQISALVANVAIQPITESTAIPDNVKKTLQTIANNVVIKRPSGNLFFKVDSKDTTDRIYETLLAHADELIVLMEDTEAQEKLSLQLSQGNFTIPAIEQTISNYINYINYIKPNEERPAKEQRIN